jgi:hypothetical protein
MEALLNSAGMFELHNASAFSINSTILAFIGFKSPLMNDERSATLLHERF